MTMTHLLEFGPFQLVVDSRLLLREGEPIALTPKAFDTLLVLAESGGRILDKEELIRQVWPDTAVEENNLTQNISKLRKVLDDDRLEHRYIVTIPRRGYKFVAPVRRVRAAKAETARGPETRLAVLPFECLTPTPSEEFLPIGIADALITRLGTSGSLVVRPTSAVTRYADPGRDVLAAGHALEVDYVLDARVQRCEERHRVTAQLVDVDEVRPVWSETFEFGASDLFALEEAVADAVAAALRARLVAPAGRSANGRPANPDAYVEYLRGRYFWSKRSPEGIEKGIACYERAVFFDPGFALAHAGLATAYTFLGLYQYNGADPRVYAEKARDAVERALLLEPRLGEALAARALIRHGFDFDWEGAEADFRLAYAAAPNYQPLDFWYAVHSLALGRYEDAERAMRHAFELDPASPMATLGLGSLLFYGRKYMKAIDCIQQTLDLEPDFYRGHICIGQCYEQIGFYDEALAHLERAQAIAGVDCETVSALGHVHARAGRAERAREALATLASLGERSFVSPYYHAVVLAGLGEAEAALDRIDEALASRSLWPLEVVCDPRIDPLRRHPRFERVLAALGL